MSSSAAILPPLLAVVGASFLVGALLIVMVGRRSGPRVASRLWTAYVTELGILAAILVPAYFGTWALLLALLGIGIASARELYGALRGIGLAPRARPGILAGSCLLVIAAVGSASEFSAVFFAATLAILGTGWVRRGSLHGAVGSASATLFGVVYPCALLAHLLLLGRLDDGFGYVVFLVGVIEINDSAALLIGSLVGGRKIWPRISPNKTVAGSVGGLGAALVGSALLAFAVPAFTLAQAVVAGLLIGVAGQAGDLVASSIKREAGLKDFSALVPAQGGVLDIYDALIFTAPVFYYYVRYAIGP